MKRNTFVMIVGSMLVASILYEAINSVLNAIESTWTPEATMTIAKSVSTGFWLIGLAMAMILLSVAYALFNWSNSKTTERYRNEQDVKVIDGQVSPPLMLSDGGNIYDGLDAWAMQGEYIDNTNNV